MDKKKAVKIDARVSKIIEIAKFIQNCDLNRWKPTILRARQDGIIREAYKLARNLN